MLLVYCRIAAKCLLASFCGKQASLDLHGLWTISCRYIPLKPDRNLWLSLASEILIDGSHASLFFHALNLRGSLAVKNFHIWYLISIYIWNIHKVKTFSPWFYFCLVPLSQARWLISHIWYMPLLWYLLLYLSLDKNLFFSKHYWGIIDKYNFKIFNVYIVMILYI